MKKARQATYMDLVGRIEQLERKNAALGMLVYDLTKERNKFIVERDQALEKLEDIREK